MPRDFKIVRRNSGKDQVVEEIENVPVNPNELSCIPRSSDSSRAPPEPALNPKPSVDQVGSAKRKCEWTPVKAKGKISDTTTVPLSTPERQGNGNFGRKRIAFSSVHECRDEDQSEMANHLNQSTRHGNSLNLTPRVGGTASRRAYRGHLERECVSTQNTPARSVSKPPNPGFFPLTCIRHPGAGSYAAVSRRFSVSNDRLCTVNTVQVAHFDLKEDPSFWMDHNVQVIIRVRPLNSFEINTSGYNRCVKQENAQSITWIAQPETRFTFDHVACETVDQEMLFRMSGLPMVENCLSGYNSCMFAYGQTGSGKTYTMLGEMEDLEFRPSSHRGMTPRIFEFLFARISAEEESRRDEKLKYSCKCSFLEIYNEQITDLLDPTSTNLLLREDVKKGVYVENLSEFEVHSVSDVLRLLIQGSSNRKVAATDMNRESSRSHSVFTCVVESKWERDSTTNLRFARLNLVDLAGSERQKSSGAEGERLKEAANINKSLSTLGHVIMLLVDIAQGKPKHVPYRDSRLTFLLQDSLGGNSKTMIIANISPSVCCAGETLNTLKFAQRAKLIQNNAVVNEDSSGDVAALQHQIWLLREELSALKCQHVSRRLAFDLSSTMEEQENTEAESRSENYHLKADNLMSKSMDKMLAGAFRREQVAETTIKQLKAEIEQLNLLVHQREEDTRCTKMMLKFREDKIQRMESLLDGLKPVDAYFFEENAALSEEIQLLRAKVDKNPEVTRFASENIRLQEQLKRFQDFYEEGERDILMNEVSELRSQLIHFLDNDKQQHNVNLDQNSTQNIEENVSTDSEVTNTLKELAECRNKLKSCLESNAKLCREVEDLHALLRNKEMDMIDQRIVETVKDVEVPHVEEQVFGTEKYRSKHGIASHAEEVLNLELELDILKIMLKEERLSCGKMDEMVASFVRDAQLSEERVLLVSKQCNDAKRDLEEAKSVIEALESQQVLSINEIEDLKNCNGHYLKLLCKQELEISALKEQAVRPRYSRFRHSELKESPLQMQLERMQASLDKAKSLNMWYQSDHAAQRSNEEEMDEIRRQAEAETADVIVSLQEELSMLQHRVQESELKEREAESKLLVLESSLKELQETLDMMSQDKELLHQNLLQKDVEIKSLTEDWEILSSEIEGALLEGNETLGSVCDQVDSISSDKRVWICEQMGRMIRHISEKESIIQELNQCLEDANMRVNDMEHMLLSLRGAAIIMSESHEQDCLEKEREILQLKLELSRKTDAIAELKQRMKLGHSEIMKVSTCATAAFVLVNRLSEMNSSHLDVLRVMDIRLKDLQEMNQKKDVSLCEKSSSFEDDLKKNESLEVSSAPEGKTTWLRAKELHAFELVDAKTTMDEKTAESSCLLAELEEAQDKITDSNMMINELKIANKTITLEIENLKKVNVVLTGEKDSLITEFKELQSSYELKDQNCKNLEEQFEQDISNITSLVKDLERSVSEAQGTCESAVVSFAHDLNCIKSQIQDAIKWLHSSVEEILSEILVKDYTLAIACLCHMGVLVDAIMRLSSENGLLSVSVCESIARISNLRKKSMKSTEELETCQMLAHRFFVDSRNSLEYISSKEAETRELSTKLSNFQEKLENLQHQEELMLENSNIMSSELAILTEKLDQSNSTVMLSSLEQERLLKSNWEAMKSQDENFMLELNAKDFELLVVVSGLQQTAHCNADMENKLIVLSSALDSFMTDIVHLRIVDDLREQLLLERETEVICLQTEAEEAKDREAKVLVQLQKLEKECMTLKEHLIANKKKNELFKNKLQEMESRNCTLLKDLREKDFESRSFMDCIDMLKSENCRLEEEVSTFASKISVLERDLDAKKAELEDTSRALAVKSRELDEVVACGEALGVKVKEQIDIITALEMDLEKANQSLKLVSDENMGLRSHEEDILAEKAFVEHDLAEKRSLLDGLENELLKMGNTLGLMNDLVECQKRNLVEISDEKDELQKKIMVLEERVETARVLAEENDAIAAEYQEIAESRRIYAKEKEEEVILLERSVLELGSTISALENKVSILKEDLETQKTKREVLELDLHSLNTQMHIIERADADIKRDLDEKTKTLQEALEHIKVVEEDLLNKDSEIAQCKMHITDLTLHAEGQTSRLRRAESFLLRVLQELVQYRSSTGTSSSVTLDEVQRLNKKLKGTEQEKLHLLQTFGLYSNSPKVEEALEQS